MSPGFLNHLRKYRVIHMWQIRLKVQRDRSKKSLNVRADVTNTLMFITNMDAHAWL
jgi:hypothetical protein